MDTGRRVMLRGGYGKIQKALLHILVEMSMEDHLILFTLVHPTLGAIQSELCLAHKMRDDSNAHCSLRYFHSLLSSLKERQISVFICKDLFRRWRQPVPSKC
jgi:hypothetical protein